MLGFITTDVNIDNKALQAAFKTNIDDSFNMVSVDGDTSTNDMVVILANGQVSVAFASSNSSPIPFCATCTSPIKMFTLSGSKQ